MSKNLAEVIEYKKNGKIKYPKSSDLVYNIKNCEIYYVKELHIIKEEDNTYILPISIETISDTYLINHFIVMDTIDQSISIIHQSIDNTNEKHTVFLDKLNIDKTTHIYNAWLIRFLKENFPGKLITNDKAKVKSILRLIVNKPEIPLKHTKVEILLPLVGTTYKIFLDWISNVKTKGGYNE